MGNLISMEQALAKSNSTQTLPQPGLTSDEKKISDSNIGVFIQDASPDELGACLLYCFSVSGLLVSNYPNEALKTVLIDFLLSSYPSFRLQEVRTAFQMNAAGRFGDVIDHFQNFSPTYFGKVMKAFRVKSQELKVYQQQAKEWNKPVQPLHKSDELTDEYMVKSSFENYLKIGKWQLVYPGCYKTLEKYGHGLTLEGGAAERQKFNKLKESERKGSINEDIETQFKKWITAVVFAKFIKEGKTTIDL
jgi:hypothetical protein